MISVTEAQGRVIDNVKLSGEIILDLKRAVGHVLSKNIYSPLDLPPIDQSAMDGYAIRTVDFLNDQKISIVGESAAGKSYSRKISAGEAVRIYTGAEIPAGADSVVMQEKTFVNDGILSIRDENLKSGLNIRSRGSHIKKGELALSKCALLTPAGVGFLAAMGLKKISVFRKPVVSIIVTGNELQKPGAKLSAGKIFESNAVALEAGLKKYGIEKVQTFFVRDDKKQTQKVFTSALRNSDFILFTGGISVGDYDFVGKVLEQKKVKEVFYKVKQKPGKPLYFGIKDKKYIFGLPGNPASVLMCFYEFVLPAIKQFSGHTECFLPAMQLPLSVAIKKKKGMTHFLKAHTDFKTVTPLDGQESYIMKSFARANCLVVVPEETENLNAGELVTVHLLHDL